ncbi:MAG: NAD(P)-dependent glycerol-3-phosphate dehydrogenase [Oscillospiraceae bacterium]|nr:NAD(P)-dependent glycerol-3-phosphate dehydrogenase [Oscillospiraceae bacterium]
MNISVFGSGAWGTAIALHMRRNGYDVTLWTKFEEEAALLRDRRENPLLGGVQIPEDIRITSDIIDAVRGAGAAMIAVPSFAVRETAEALRGKLADDCLAVCMSKGIEKDTSSLFTGIIRNALGDRTQIAAVSGPTHAEEVARCVPTGCVAASEDIAVAEKVQAMLMNDYLRVYTSTDVIGVELGAALKNVIALCAGICDGLGYGDNTIAMLMTRGLAEIAGLCVKMGGRKETLAGLTGLGDLIVTCMSRHSRNRRAGILIGQGLSAEDAMRQVGAVVEGYYAAKAAREMSVDMCVDMPICCEAYRVLHEGKSPDVGMRELMSRSRKSEQEIGGEETGEERWVMA